MLPYRVKPPLQQMLENVRARIGKRHHHRLYKERKACRECATYMAKYAAVVEEEWERKFGPMKQKRPNA